MKVVILAGGYGTRLAEHTSVIPKPMVEIGGKPMLWHIMNIYASQGYRDFVVALGYKGHVVKDYFLAYRSRQADFSLSMDSGEVEYLSKKSEHEDWHVTLVDTGTNVMTGGRLGRLREHLSNEAFMLTYGDGVADVNLVELVKHHDQNRKTATLTAVHPKAHYGELELEGSVVRQFLEKPQFRQSWINGGFMVLEPEVLDCIRGDSSVLEIDILEHLSDTGQLAAYRHSGFWQCMDTVRDVKVLNDLCDSGNPPWMIK